MSPTIQRVDFVIERPKPAHHSHTAPHFDDFLKFLDANPGLWAVYYAYPTKDASTLKARRANKAHGARGYEFVTRRGPEGFKLYGRKLAHTLAPHTEG